MKNNSTKIIFLFLGLLICKNIFAVTESKITSMQILTSTLSVFSNCIHYKIKGVCYWAGKTGVTTTPYVEHYLPDLVITVFDKARDNPWAEANIAFDQAGKVAQDNIVSNLTGLDSGAGQHSFSDNHEQNVFFKEADVIGNPAIETFKNFIIFRITIILLFNSSVNST